MDTVFIFLIFAVALLLIIFGAYYLLREHIKLTQTLINKITPLLEVGNQPIDMPNTPLAIDRYTPEYTENNVPLDQFVPKNGVKVKFVDPNLAQKVDTKDQVTPMEETNG